MITGQRANKLFFYDDGLERLREAARRHGGECLANEYVGSNARYRFRCAVGHEWEQKASYIWKGTQWCRRCADFARRVPIETLQAIAAERGGRCLSPRNEGSRVKLTWQCHLGHIWQTTTATIKQGAWCPNCAKLRQTENHMKRKRYDFEG